MTLEECGGVLGVGYERVRQMENKGIRILRQPKNAACLRRYRMGSEKRGQETVGEATEGNNE